MAVISRATVIGSAISGLAGLLLGLAFGARTLAQPPPHVGQAAARGSLHEALRVLAETDDEQAHRDLLVAAARLDPSHPEVFERIVDSSREMVAVAPDISFELAELADALVASQPIENIARSRERVDLLFERLSRETLRESAPTQRQESGVSQIRQRLARIEAASAWPPEVRFEALNQIIVEATLLASQTLAGGDELLSLEEYTSLQSLVDVATRKVWQATLENDLVPDVQAWQDGLEDLQTKAASLPSDIDSLDRELTEAFVAGLRLVDRVQPSVDAEVSIAPSLSAEIRRDIELVDRLRSETYNRWAMRVIRAEDNGRSNGDDERKARLQRLVAIDEARLYPAFGRRFDALWEKLSEDLDEEDQIEFLYKRIRR